MPHIRHPNESEFTNGRRLLIWGIFLKCSFSLAIFFQSVCKITTYNKMDRLKAKFGPRRPVKTEMKMGSPCVDARTHKPPELVTLYCPLTFIPSRRKVSTPDPLYSHAPWSEDTPCRPGELCPLSVSSEMSSELCPVSVFSDMSGDLCPVSCVQ